MDMKIIGRPKVAWTTHEFIAERTWDSANSKLSFPRSLQIYNMRIQMLNWGALKLL